MMAPFSFSLQAMEQYEPLSPLDFVDEIESLTPFKCVEQSVIWPVPSAIDLSQYAWEFNELMQDPMTQRVKVSSQEMKDFALKLFGQRLETPENIYRVACCIVAGANKDGTLILKVFSMPDVKPKNLLVTLLSGGATAAVEKEKQNEEDGV